MKTFLTLFALSLGLNFQANAYTPQNCDIKELKVQYRTEFSNADYKGYLVGNLELSFWLTDRNPKVRSYLERSFNDKNQSFELTFPDFMCEMIKQSQGGRGRPMVGNPNAIKDSRITTTTDCIDCVNLSNAPVAFEFPSMSNINDILSEAIGLDDKQVNKFKHELYATLKTMNYKTPQANAIALIMITLETLADFGVEVIHSHQLEHLTSLLEGDITEDERGFFREISRQVERIEINHYTDGTKAVVVKSRTLGPVKIDAASIPARSPEDKAFMQEHLDYISLDHGAQFVFKPKKNSREQKVEVKGLEIKGLMPVLGKIGIRPQSFVIDLNAPAPVEAKVQFRKGIRISKTFSMDY